MKYKEIIILLASAFLVVIAWIIFNIYHNSVVSTTPEDLKKEIVPISPTFDRSTIDKLKSRAKISPIYDQAPQSTPPTEISVGSPSALTASPGGQIVP